MKTRTAGDTIITRAQTAGSTATTRTGARRYLLAHLRVHPGIAHLDAPQRVRAQHQNNRAWRPEARLTRRADGRAVALGYPASNPEYILYCEAYARNGQHQRYREDYLSRALAIPAALGATITSSWDGSPMTIHLGAGRVARADWDTDSDWEAYGKSYGRPKNTYSNRRIDVYQWLPDTGIVIILTVPVEAFRSHFLRRALIEIGQRLDMPSLVEAVRGTPTPREGERLEQATPKPCYKRVAVSASGAYVSIYDGATVYLLGATIVDTPRRCPDYDDICGYGGIFAHATREKAETQEYPSSSQALDLPRVTLRGEYWGRTNINGKIAAEYFRPLEIVT